MKEHMTLSMKEELGELAKDHFDTLVAFGADMHREGIIKGAVVGVAAFAIGELMTFVVSEMSKKRKSKIEEEGS